MKTRNDWRAGYIERCTSGSEGGSRKPAVVIQQGGWFLPYNDEEGSLLSVLLSPQTEDVLEVVDRHLLRETTSLVCWQMLTARERQVIEMRYDCGCSVLQTA